MNILDQFERTSQTMWEYQKKKRKDGKTKNKTKICVTYHADNNLSGLLCAFNLDLFSDIGQTKRKISRCQLLDDPSRCSLQRLIDQARVLILDDMT